MELHQLRYFCAIADTSSFSRAAQQSHVSQPSLSQQIGKLKTNWGRGSSIASAAPFVSRSLDARFFHAPGLFCLTSKRRAAT